MKDAKRMVGSGGRKTSASSWRGVHAMPRRVRLLSASDSHSFLSQMYFFLNGGERWTARHFSVFFLTFISYAFLHASRKTLSTVKGSLVAKWTSNDSLSHDPLFPSPEAAQSFLAVLDCGFLAAYAVGLYISGPLGDRCNPSRVLAFGMCSSAITVFLFGTVTEWLHFYSKMFYASCWIVCGLLQSVGWPTEICIMGNWFGHNSRGAVLGLWSSCASVGNIIGTLISSRSLYYGYEYAFASNAALLFVSAFFICGFLTPSPRDAGLPDAAESRDYRYRVIEEVTERPNAIGFFRAWLLPGVICYSLAYACLKLVNYSFFFWLPFYLHNNFGWSEPVADALSAWYDWGGIIAAIVAGVASDHVSSRTPIVISMLLLSMGALFAYANSPKDYLINSILMALTGFFVGGPANLISSAISADLGKADEIRGSAEALSTVTGIVDGTGSVGASIGQLLLPVVQQAFGWHFVFYAFIVMIFCTFLCLVPLLWRELRERSRYRYEVVPSDEGRGLYGDTEEDAREGEEEVLLPHAQTTRRHVATSPTES